MKYEKLTYVIPILYPFSLFSAYSPHLLSDGASLNPTPMLQVPYVQKNIKVSDREQKLIDHVKNCVNNSFFETSSITKEVENDIEGMSSPKIRHLLNNLCKLPHTRYLEIGTFRGSTFIPALFKNQSTIDYAVGIDNWSEFGGPRHDFERYLKQFLPVSSYCYETYSMDCFAINPKDYIKAPINIYFYDGNHSAYSQEMAFLHYNDILDDVFITLVDDWCEESARVGTMNAFKKLNYEILYEISLPGPYTLWWNGLYIAVIRKLMP